MNAEMTDFRRLRAAFTSPLNWQLQKPVTPPNSTAPPTALPRTREAQRCAQAAKLNIIK